ncbi:hypothetical protein SSS_00435 [Sarcoptes scabiei]|uniref:Uncharacterized protein n=1 Tax=Sarcoptes scabiei TaxID=52283 RepID=A0A834R2B9_SARSC|nr:hypothetical protein SSS_00435 [Sarcoptes scabiei]
MATMMVTAVPISSTILSNNITHNEILMVNNKTVHGSNHSIENGSIQSQQFNHQSKPILAFPPMHCLQDSDCIGKNGSSKIFYDPNGRCDIRQNICICNDSKRFKRVQIKVNIKTLSHGNHHHHHHHHNHPQHQHQHHNQHPQQYHNQLNAINSNNNNNYNNNSNHPEILQTFFISKCLSQDFGSNQMMDETVSIVYRPHYYGQPCDDDRQCLSNMICRQLIITGEKSSKNGTNNGNQSGQQQQQQQQHNPSKSSLALSLANFLTVNRTKRCRCPIGQHWNKYTRRCDWLHSDSLFQFGLATDLNDHHSSNPQLTLLNGNNFNLNNHGNNLVNNNNNNNHNNGNNVGFGQSIHQISTSNIDLKIFEIVLEIAFLLACLLGYKACSSFCCKDDQNDPTISSNHHNINDGCFGSGDERDSSASDINHVREIKSDEESILSSSILNLQVILHNRQRSV